MFTKFDMGDGTMDAFLKFEFELWSCDGQNFLFPVDKTVKTHRLYNSLLLLHKPSCLPVMRSSLTDYRLCLCVC